VTPTFTVVMPAYNAARTIGPAIRSVLDQSRSDFELVVVDDGSTDSTSASAEASGDSRMVLISQENGGAAAALNTAVARARGRYVSRLDADDLYLPVYLERMGEALDAAPQAGFAYTDAWVLDDRSRRIARATAMASERPPVPPPVDPVSLLVELLERNFVWVAGMVRRSAFETVGSFNVDLEVTADYEMWLRLAAHGYRAARVDGPLGIYRRAWGSLSTDLLKTATETRAIYTAFVDDHRLPEAARNAARRRVSETDVRIRAVRRSGLRRRVLPTRLRRLLGRGYRATRSRRAWLDAPPADLAAAFPGLIGFASESA
jgi:glycosyltransferase involved in cell wall biosynthesis